CVGGPERRLRITLLEVLVDDGRLREQERILLEHRNAPLPILLVDPGRPFVEVDLYDLVLDALLGERDAHARAVRAAAGVVEGDHRSILASSPSTSEISFSSSRAGGSSDGDDAIRATARTRPGSAPVSLETSVAFAESESSSALLRPP